MALDATVGGASSNSYVTEIEADSYFEDRLDATGWTGATSTKEPALVTASLMLDDRMDWVGEKKTTTQAMGWPRVDEDEQDIESGVIPPLVKRATYELALYLLDNGEPATDTSVDEVVAGSIEVNLNEKQHETLLPDRIAAIISDYGGRKSAGSSVRVVDVWR